MLFPDADGFMVVEYLRQNPKNRLRGFYRHQALNIVKCCSSVGQKIILIRNNCIFRARESEKNVTAQMTLVKDT